MKLLSSLFYLSTALAVPPAQGAGPAPFPLAGSWTLVAADLLHPDGRLTRDYGAAPAGSLLIDVAGRYGVQIYQSERLRFASGDKKTGTGAEFESAVMGASAHFGTLTVDAAAHMLMFHIESAAFKNWEGTRQQRSYELNGDELRWQVPPRPDGTIPVSIWRRIQPQVASGSTRP